MSFGDGVVVVGGGGGDDGIDAADIASLLLSAGSVTTKSYVDDPSDLHAEDANDISVPAFHLSH